MLTRRLFIRLTSAFIVGLSLNLPLGQHEIIYNNTESNIIDDIKSMIKALNSSHYYGPYTIHLTEKQYNKCLN